jgi:hypothetical protein
MLDAFFFLGLQRYLLHFATFFETRENALPQSIFYILLLTNEDLLHFFSYATLVCLKILIIFYIFTKKCSKIMSHFLKMVHTQNITLGIFFQHSLLGECRKKPAWPSDAASTFSKKVDKSQKRYAGTWKAT